MYLYDLCQLCFLLNKITCTNIIDYYMYLLIRCGENNLTINIFDMYLNSVIISKAPFLLSKTFKKRSQYKSQYFRPRAFFCGKI